MSTLKLTGYIGLLAAIFVGTGELFLHYSPNILNIEGSFDFLAAVPTGNLKIGHIFVLLGIPLYFIGYYHFYLMLKAGGEKISKLFYAIAAIAFGCGAIWIASRGFIGQIIHMKNVISPEIFSQIEAHYFFYFENLLGILRILLFVISALWIYLISTGNTNYPRYMIIFSPIALLFLMFSTALVPSFGKFVVPIALNPAHFILFALSLYHVSKLK
ncbi:hypothetical protein OAN96_00340 [Candidatus Gracilibacteria bacterium]|nr:hypothetical protein [Candidatus Gracilibacteria bacterium]